MTIIGVSFDDIAANAAFASNNGFQYELWTDQDKTLALYYGAAASAAQAIPGRISRLLDENGEVLLEYDSVNPAIHPQQVLEDCQQLFGD